MKKFYLLLSACFILTAFSKAQTIVTLPASQDNTIYSESTNNSNGAGENFTAGTIQTGAIRRGLIRFDLTSIPAGANITAVSLRLVVDKTVSGSNDIFLHNVLQAWGEGASEAIGTASGQGVAAAANDATWACSFANGAAGCITSWTTAGGWYSATPSATTAVAGIGEYTWAGTQAISDVQQWVNNSSSNFGWVIRTAEVVTQSAKRFASRTYVTVADRPSLTITYTSTVPVTMSRLLAGAVKQGALLSWKTFQETNNSFFEIEHSTDASNFTVAGRVAGAGNSSQELSYSFIHDKALPGRNFYRLRQTDFNGRTTFSNIEPVLLSAKKGTLIVSPNPVTDKIYLTTVVLEKNPTYTLYNQKGQLLQKGNLTNRYILLAPGLRKAVYHLRIMYADGTTIASNFFKN